MNKQSIQVDIITLETKSHVIRKVELVLLVGGKRSQNGCMTQITIQQKLCMQDDES